jgi:hypothetical protein
LPIAGADRYRRAVTSDHQTSDPNAPAATPTIRPVPEGPPFRLLVPAASILILIIVALILLGKERPAGEHEGEPGEPAASHEPVESVEGAVFREAETTFRLDGIDLRLLEGRFGHASGSR